MKPSVKRVLAIVIVFILSVGTIQNYSTCTLFAAGSKSVKSKGVEHKILNERRSTARVVGSVKSIRKAVIRDKIKISKKNYKLTIISQNSFKNRKNLRSVTIGSNITSIGKSAFSGAKRLNKITIKSKQLKKIGKAAFAGISKKAKFIVPYGTLKKMNKLIKRKSIGWKKTMQVVQAKKKNSKEKNNNEETKDVEDYDYSVIPLTDNICSYFYVKTDNPDPKSFVFSDDTTKLSDKKVKLSMCKSVFADVDYVNKDQSKVKGGYIFSGADCDGGTLKLQKLEKNSSQKYIDTKKTVSCAELTSKEQYLINTYSNNSMSFFEKMDAIEKGLNEICLYSGVYVLGSLKKSTESPYYGLSTSPHVDQDFYIQDPYYRDDSQPMLISSLYPYRLDSIGFPSELGAVAKLLDPNVKCNWNSSAHYLIDVTYNGETRVYGGQGNGGGQGIKPNMLNHKYTFDNSSNDFSINRSWNTIVNKIREYGKMKVPSEIPPNEELTWEQISDTVGNGSYVQLIVITSIFGSSHTGYTYLYKNDYGVGYFSDCWYDGRYFNSWEFFEKGAKFEDYPNATIVIKDFEAKLPDDGKIYYYNYSEEALAKHYNKETGIWTGYNRFYYDSTTNTWKHSMLNSLMTGNADGNLYDLKPVTDEGVVNSLTLTLDEVREMNIDKKTDEDPTDYYIYDTVSPPGTKVGN